MMEILLRDSDVVSLVLGFLHSRQLYESVLALERESGILAPKDESLPQDLKFLRQLALDGQWELFLSFMEPFTHLEEFDSKALYYLVLRQRYFEALSMSKNHTERDTEALKAILQDVRPYCSKDEYHQLCQARNHSDLHDWSVIASRFRCFNNILVLVGPLYSDDSVGSMENGGSGDSWWQHAESRHSADNKLLSILTSALLYKECGKYCMDRAMGTRSADAELPWVTSANLEHWGWSVSLDTAWLFWLRSLQQDELFQQQYQKEDVDVKIEYLKKRATPKDVPSVPEPAAKFSSLTSLANEQKEFLRSQNAPVMTQSLQFTSKDRAGPQQHPASASGPAHSSYARNFSNNNNNENAGSASMQSQSQSHTMATSSHEEPSGEDRLHAASENFLQTPSTLQQDQPLQFPAPQQSIVSDHNSNIIFKETNTHPPPLEGSQGRQGHGPEGQEPVHEPAPTDQENPTTIEKAVRPKEMKRQQNSQITDKPLRDSSNLMNGTPEGHPGPSSQVTDSYADFLEEKKKLKLEKQNFLHQLESREKEKDEIRKLLQESPKNGPTAPLQPVIAEIHSQPLEDRTRVDMAQSQYLKAAIEKRSPRSKPAYVPIEVTEDAQAIRAVSFHPSGLVYGIGSNSKTLRVCAVPGHIVFPYSETSSSTTSKDLSSSNSSVLKPSKVLVKRIHVHKGSVYSLAWNEEGSLLASGSNDKLIKVHRFDVLAKTLSDTPQDIAVHRGIVREVLFLHGRGDLLASAGGDAFIYTTDITREKIIHKLAGHSDHVLSLFDWHHTMLASSSQDKSVRLWDLRTPSCVSIIGAGGKNPCIPTSVCVDGTNRWLALGCDNQNVGLYDLAAGKMAIEYKAHDGEVRSVRFNPVKPNCLLSSSYDGTVALTDVDGLLSEVDPLASVGYHISTIAKCKEKIIQCRWHPNGEDFASTSVDKTCKLWHNMDK